MRTRIKYKIKSQNGQHVYLTERENEENEKDIKLELSSYIQLKIHQRHTPKETTDISHHIVAFDFHYSSVKYEY